MDAGGDGNLSNQATPSGGGIAFDRPLGVAGEIGYFVKQPQNHTLRTCAIVRGFRITFGRESKTADLCENMDQIDQEVVLMVKRYGPRVELACKVVLAADRSRYEGRVLDVSLPGCLIECVHAFTCR